MEKIKSPFRFIISPLNDEQYINTKEIFGVKLTVNTSIENAEDVQRYAKVIEVPMIYDGDIKAGDTVIVQHNVFRITTNDKGIPMQSNNFIKENLFYVDEELIYLVINEKGIKASNDNVFVEPITEILPWLGEVEKKHTGIVKYSNKDLNAQGVKDGDTIIFRKECEYPFNINEERLYKMSNKRILAKVTN